MTSPALLGRTLAENLRDACLAAYDDLADAPSKPTGVIHHDGPAPTIDCGDLLVVQLASLTSAFQGPVEACAIVPQFTFVVTVTRCIPNLDDWGRVAEHDDLTDAALSLADDASVLQAGVTARCAAGTLWAGVSDIGCRDTQFRDMRPGASGGIGWWTWTVLVTPAGYLL